jgi:hypothetical protein
MVLDGRHRYNACLLKGIEPRFVDYHGPNPLGLVISLNLKRRHLNESQRATIASKLATLRDGQRKTTGTSIDAVTQSEAANLLNVSRPSVQRARYVQDHGVPELVAAVEQGDVAVSAAAAFVRDHPPTVQDELIVKAGGSVAAAVRKAMAVKEKADRAEKAAAAKLADTDREPRFNEFKRVDGQIKSACDFNGEDPGDVAEPGDSKEMIRHRIFMHRASEALRHARENGFEAASANEITDEIVAASSQAAEAWADLTSELQRRSRFQKVKAAADRAEQTTTAKPTPDVTAAADRAEISMKEESK